ncbi:4'-phosphopantetheinyl transferase superfamily protein [Marinimicrobium sp. C6131]|uniref:4'-phosphopantetheinyl transferase family protein n=1 Tax=Marinimicrobium sp. C6131 TaxID=3022676 RepID=UPI00223CB419|nr:4'-phosphopantetheinyl transferase superfamily protein [Marinimicrobium sp. C6131]UZJ44552.1 4'-phosphopantetheinyl transferase superfamily protein [Marinimicrobium sp. C6131]
MILQPHNIVHLWLIDQRSVHLDEQRDTFEQWLSDEERQGLDHYSRPELRDEQLITRAGLRSSLSQYSDSIPPKRWHFERSERGKPRLSDDSPMSELSFNLSHSRDWLAIGITVNKPIGVDLQHRHHQKPLTELAERFFSGAEANELANLPESRQSEHFFRLWTLKEAYLKARGLGIANGLDKARFHIDNNGLITAEFDDSLNDDPHDWQFHHYELDDDYCLSLALKQHRAQDASTHFYKLIPGGRVEPLECIGHQIQLQ